jgi:integrase
LLREIPVGRRTLIHIKAFLSAVFKHAKQEGVMDGLNPIVDVSVPGRPSKFKGAAYTVAEVLGMLECLEPKKGQKERDARWYMTASDVISVLSFTGLRQSECMGLRCPDWDEEKQVLNISRSLWRTKVGPTMNVVCENSIPVIPLLVSVLKLRREQVKPTAEDYILAGERRRTPLNFHNLVVNVIKPALEESKPKTERLKMERRSWTPAYLVRGIAWRGFHGFRRGLASNLLGLGIHPKLVQDLETFRHHDHA